MKKIGLVLWFFATITCINAQLLTPLTVEKIMRDPKWIGVSPSMPLWSADSKSLYFFWNPENNSGDSLYAVTISNHSPAKVAPTVRRSLPSAFGIFNRTRTKKVFEKNGDIFLIELPSGKTTNVTNTVDRESNPFFSADERKVFFSFQSNLFSWEIATGLITQVTDLHKGLHKDQKLNDQEKWLKAQQLNIFDVIKTRSSRRAAGDKIAKADRPKRPKEIYIDEKTADNFQVTADENFIVYRLTKSSQGKNAFVPNYVTESGFTEDISSRSKVGVPPSPSELYVYDVRRDTVRQVSIDDVEGISESPAYLSAYKKKEVKKDAGDGKSKDKKEMRAVSFSPLLWSPDGTTNVIVMRSIDNKDRWILSLDPAALKFSVVDRQHDDAWVAGSFFGNTNMGWLNDSKTLWFLSETSGYSHLYTIDVLSKKKTTLTSGDFEVQNVQLSADHKFFYITANQTHPGERNLFRLPVAGGMMERITALRGANEAVLSPDEKWIAIRNSYSNVPWEIYLQENRKGATAQQITFSLSPEFKSYPWRDPEIVTIKASDGQPIYSRVFTPAKPNGAAVVFVHGAGYLQNAHRWWSSYFREYMFHNLLADQGYTVLDMDYRASAGYGRDWRTGIYRFMGGKDLTDNMDGAKWLVEKHNIDPKRIGIYGGSYGGFITLMAMFTAPDVFAAGAALRPVTDWAHYNHGYTSAILNEPAMDSIAYAKSSPIYFADGLKGSLLICHGMVDTNVHFQDAVRLTQRLIELKKDNWELAVYPVEDHGFVEPSSWTDEFKRILKLFDEKLK